MDNSVCLKDNLLCTGVAVGSTIGSGAVKLIFNLDTRDCEEFKEGDVLVEDYPKEVLAEEYISELVNQMELIIEAIEHLRDFEPGDFEEI